MAGWADVGTSFVSGFSAGSQASHRDKELELAKQANQRAQETHDYNTWQQKKASAFVDANDQFNTTGDPNAYLPYFQTYHPQMFPSAEGQYRVAADPETGVSTLMQAGQDGSQTAVTAPNGQPLSFTADQMRNFALGHIDPRAMTQVAQARQAAQAKVSGAQEINAAATENPQIAGALGALKTTMHDTGGSVVPVKEDMSGGLSVGSPLYDKTLPPSVLNVDTGNKRGAVQIGGTTNGQPNTGFTEIGFWDQKLNPHDAASVELQQNKWGYESYGHTQNYLQGKIKSNLDAIKAIDSKYGGNPDSEDMDIDPNAPLTGNDALLKFFATLSKASKPAADLEKKAKAGDPEAKQLLEQRTKYMNQVMAFADAITTMPTPGLSALNGLSGASGAPATKEGQPSPGSALASGLAASHGQGAAAAPSGAAPKQEGAVKQGGGFVYGGKKYPEGFIIPTSDGTKKYRITNGKPELVQ